MKKFLTINDMHHILRAHQLCMEGFSVLYDDRLSTVWSAPNYCYRCGNMASILEIGPDGHKHFNVFDAAPENERDGPQQQMQLQQQQQQLQMQHQQSNGGQDNGVPNPYMLPQVEYVCFSVFSNVYFGESISLCIQTLLFPPPSQSWRWHCLVKSYENSVFVKFKTLRI